MHIQTHIMIIEKNIRELKTETDTEIEIFKSKAASEKVLQVAWMAGGGRGSGCFSGGRGGEGGK